MERRLLTPEEIAAQAGSGIPFLRLADRADVFRQRAARLRALAANHAMGDYLRLIAIVADAQQARLDAMPPIPLPSPDFVETCREHGMPPLNVQTHHRDGQWRDVLRRMLREIADRTEGAAHDVATRLEGRRDDFLEAQASKLLGGITLGLDIAAAPLVGAALQVYFTHLSTTLGEAAFSAEGVATLCPCCGSRPVSSVVRIGGVYAGYRFLHCSLCNAEWHMVRVKCTNCESTKGVGYLSLESGVEGAAAAGGKAAARPAVSAECCDECGTYLKVCSMERDREVDPVADDLATIALDLLVTEAGKEPSGVNLMLVHGDPDAAPEGIVSTSGVPAPQ